MFDDPQRSLSRMRAILRLKKDIKTEFTFKSNPYISEVVRKSKEFSVEISNLNIMRATLEHLGNNVYQRLKENGNNGNVEIRQFVLIFYLWECF
jgi:adenylate cyclase class IV